MNTKRYYPGRMHPRHRSAEQQLSSYKDPNNDIRFFRIQTIAFVIFYITLFLLVIGTTDTMLFLETPIQLPFVEATLPLLGLYSFAPWFLLGWHVLMLFHARQHYRRLDREQRRHPQVFEQLILVRFEQTVVSDQRRAWVALNICLYWLLPLAVLIGFYYRFADYQDQFISRLHFIIIMLDLILIAWFGIWARKIIIITGVVCAGVIGWYQFFIVEPIHNPNTPPDPLIYYSLDPDWEIRGLPAWMIPNLPVWMTPILHAWMIPRLNVQGNVLVSDSAVLDVLYGHDPNSSAANTVNNKLPLTDRSKRLFRFADFKGSVIPRTNFSEAHLEGADLGRASLEGADLGRANLAGADLGRTNLEGANLGRANLAGANLREAYLAGANLEDANLAGADLWLANLARADLWRANLAGAELREAYLAEANLRQAHLAGGDLWQAHLAGADLEDANLEGAYLRLANLEGAYLREANLEGASLWLANLEGADLREANLKGADLKEANLEGANLWQANLAGAELWQANLAGANLREANLEGADLWLAHLEGADLWQAHLEGASLWLANLAGASLWQAHLAGVVLREANLQGAYDNPSKFSFVGRIGVQDYLKPNNPLFKHKLTQKTINEVKDRLQKNEVSEKIQTRIIDRLQERVGQATYTTYATFGPLTQDTMDRVDRWVRNPKARERLGLVPLARPQSNTVR